VTRRGWVLFVAMSVIWGVPYLMIRVAVEELSPGTLVFLRTALAALLLVPIAAARGEVRPALVRWRWLVVFTAVEIAVPWVLLSSAETHVSSSLAALIIAGVPLVGAAIARASGERLGRSNLAGLLVGLAGVGAIVGTEIGGGSATAFAELGVVAVCYAVGPIILARYLDEAPALAVIAVSLGIAALAYAPVAALHPPDGMLSGRVIASVLGLAFLCTALAFLLFFALIAEIGPVRATVITYVNPAVAAIAGVTILDEAFTVGMGVGFVLVLIGSFFATRPGAKRRPSPALLEPAVAETKT
jgi:drug/metabolite transporter (DMT)-like permease